VFFFSEKGAMSIFFFFRKGGGRPKKVWNLWSKGMGYGLAIRFSACALGLLS
jgi:hypothetical protein